MGFAKLSLQPFTMTPHDTASEDGHIVEIVCRDGIRLGGHLWRAKADARAKVIINSATGVLSRYYHRYARFLTEHNFDVLTYDYRGIGASRPERLRGCGYRWRDWGEQDFDAALRFIHDHGAPSPMMVVGHSIGGFLPGLAPSAPLVSRMLTVGAQYAWWGDYAPRSRLQLFLKWHVFMPGVTAALGFFPGRRFGWFEDLPAGVANEWSFHGPKFERSFPREKRDDAVARMAAITAPVLAIAVADDEIATPQAIRRTLRYYSGAEQTLVLIKPSDYGRESIGHFRLFHGSHAPDFWQDTILWLRDGISPWAASGETTR